MRYLLVILLLVSGVASAQLPAGQYLKVKEDGTGFELVTVPFATGTRLRDSMALAWQKMADSSTAIRNLIDTKAATNHTHTGVYQPVGSYLVAADISGKQNTLVSGTNIKTVNGSSLLGSGDVSISGTAAWGSVTGTLSNQTDLQTALNGKQSSITTGTTAQYFKGDLSLGTYTGYSINVQALTSSPTDAQTVYFGTLPKAPVTAAATSKIYVRQAGTITAAEIYCYSGTAGTNESWSLYIRVNNTTDYLIATVSAATSERVFTNSSLSISLSTGDYFEIKGVQPTWATNPLTTIYGGYVRIN